MALFRRERTGEGAVIDVSLLNTGMWALGPDIAAAPSRARSRAAIGRPRPTPS
jgi:formyl-CoA transferase